METVWKPEPQILDSLVQAVPEILRSQKANGQFGTEPWICGDQNLVLALAAAWSLKDSLFLHDGQVLQAIVRGGDALIDAQDEKGMWTFRKKDHSTWGQILMPWTYSRWIRAYAIVRDAMSPEARQRWDTALRLGFDGISRTCLGGVHNIPAHHAMGLYVAGTVFQRDDWKAQAQAFLQRVIEKQSVHGWWSEHVGPVVAYNFVYLEALGVYHALSGDASVLDSLERGARFHAAYTYPDGSSVETIDERNPYGGGVHLGNAGFTWTAAGRGFLAQQHRLFLGSGKRFDPDYAAGLLLYGGQGPVEETPAGRMHHRSGMGDQALIWRHGPWFLSLSAFVCRPTDNRWVQDRQNFISVFHDQAGLIVGGGNTKLQPLWSNFTVGDPSLLRHVPGNAEPCFRPTGPLLHVPERASIQQGKDAVTLRLEYGPEVCAVTVAPEDDRRLRLIYEATYRSGMPVEGHVILMPRLGQPVRFASGEAPVLGPTPLDVRSDWMEHGGWRLSLPPGARVVWPVLPHNPYRKGGEAEASEGRLVVVLPFDGTTGRHDLLLDGVTH